jgi:hypothetical protein
MVWTLQSTDSFLLPLTHDAVESESMESVIDDVKSTSGCSACSIFTETSNQRYYLALQMTPAALFSALER